MEQKLVAKDFASDQDIKWCPGCGDYSILKQVQAVMPLIGVPKEDIVFISGIGCSSRFPYYMDTYGMHSIHGRATAIASGLKIANPSLSVWIVTGDGDGLSIGGNHLIHLLRRNIDANILLFNNEIYGLTKGQYSPTSKRGLKTKSSPQGTIEQPFNPLSLAMGAGASFIARGVDKDPKRLKELLLRTHRHKGTSLLEIYQNCIVFNDGTFDVFTERSNKTENTIYLEHDRPLVFGKNKQKGVVLEGFIPKVVNLENDKYTLDDLWVHDEKDKIKANILISFFETPIDEYSLPRPFGVIYQENRSVYEDDLIAQINQSIEGKGNGDIDQLLRGPRTWTVH